MPVEGLPASVGWAAILLTTLLVLDAVRRADWAAPTREHAMWALATAGVFLARQMTVTMPGGLSLQYIGSAWLALLLGYPRAVLSMSLIAAARAAQFDLPVADQALPLLVLGIAPAWLIWLITRGLRRWLPPNLFVFLLGAGFLGLFVAYALPLLAAAGLGAWALAGATGPPLRTQALTDYWAMMLPYALLLASGETWLEGMLTTLLVVFAPGSVRLFDERHYLRRR
jgi:uncharacterized membrane protein